MSSSLLIEFNEISGLKIDFELIRIENLITRITADQCYTELLLQLIGELIDECRCDEVVIRFSGCCDRKRSAAGEVSDGLTEHLEFEHDGFDCGAQIHPLKVLKIVC